MSRALLQREIRLRLGRRSLTVAALLWGAGSLALGLLSLGAGMLVAGEAGEPRATLNAAALIRTAVVALAAPCLILPAVATERTAGLSVLYLSRWRTPTLLLAKSAVPALGALSMVLLSGLPLWVWAWQVEEVPAVALLRVELVLLSFALAALALGLLCSLLFPDLSAAAGVAFLSVALAAAAPLLCAPLIEGLSDAGGVIQASLTISPLVAVASALDFDILRTEPLYRLSPMGQRRFTYPPAAASSLSYLGVGILVFGATVWRLAAARGGGKG